MKLFNTVTQDYNVFSILRVLLGLIDPNNNETSPGPLILHFKERIGFIESNRKVLIFTEMRSLTSKQWLPNCEEDKHGGEKRKATLLRSRYHICTWHKVVSYLFGTAHLFKTSRSKSAI